MSNGWGSGSIPPGAQPMPPDAWAIACGFRFVYGQLKALDTNFTTNPNCTVVVEVCEGQDVTLTVDSQTILIGLLPVAFDGSGNPQYPLGEFVLVNVRASDAYAFSIKRYFHDLTPNY